MKIMKWNTLTKEQQQNALRRSDIDKSDVTASVEKILSDIKINGDNAVKKYTSIYDQVDLESFYVTDEEINRASERIDSQTIEAIKIAYQNIKKFHIEQIPKPIIVEPIPGVFLEKSYTAIESVGLYIPSGSAPLFSTVLMLGIPAKIAGCSEIVLTTPANSNGEVNDLILYCARLVGIKKILKLGGAQAIAAMGFGTETVKKVDKIFGPGNAYVTEAKVQVSNIPNGATFDIVAGPSELLVICDSEAELEFVSADLLSQAEHDSNSQVICLVTSEDQAFRLNQQLAFDIQKISRQDIARQAIKNSKIIVCENLNEAVDISNRYAPEHLIINTKNPLLLKNRIKNAGSVFLGKYACESIGDYASGTNHVLPTYGNAKSSGGVDLLSFMKAISFQNINKNGFLSLAKSVEIMAQLENLDAHAKAVTVRRNRLSEED